MEIDIYNCKDKEVLLYAYISEYTTLNITSYKFLSNEGGMGCFGVEFEVRNKKVKYYFEREYGEILINGKKLMQICTAFDENRIKENVKIIEEFLNCK